MSIIGDMADPQRKLNALNSLRLKLLDPDVQRALEAVAFSNWKKGLILGGAIGGAAAALIALIIVLCASS